MNCDADANFYWQVGMIVCGWVFLLSIANSSGDNVSTTHSHRQCQHF